MEVLFSTFPVPVPANNIVEIHSFVKTRCNTVYALVITVSNSTDDVTYSIQTCTMGGQWRPVGITITSNDILYKDDLDNIYVVVHTTISSKLHVLISPITIIASDDIAYSTDNDLGSSLTLLYNGTDWINVKEQTFSHDISIKTAV